MQSNMLLLSSLSHYPSHHPILIAKQAIANNVITSSSEGKTRVKPVAVDHSLLLTEQVQSILNSLQIYFDKRELLKRGEDNSHHQKDIPFVLLSEYVAESLQTEFPWTSPGVLNAVFSSLNDLVTQSLRGARLHYSDDRHHQRLRDLSEAAAGLSLPGRDGR
jgi:hypothetical protein